MMAAYRSSAPCAGAGGAALIGLMAGCAGPLSPHAGDVNVLARATPPQVETSSRPGRRSGNADPSDPAPSAADRQDLPALADDASLAELIDFAMLQSPRIAAATESWRAAAERIDQAAALPDPQLTLGVFLREVETRTGPQQARVGVRQAFPWPGSLRGREDAAVRAARAAWHRLAAERLAVTRQVLERLHDLAELDASIEVAAEQLDLLQSFEEIARVRYRVGASGHPELVRVQVALGEAEDRLSGLRAMRPSHVAGLNAALGRPAGAATPTNLTLPGRVATDDAATLAAAAIAGNPVLLALDERVAEQRMLAAAVRADGQPTFAVGLEGILTGDAIDPTIDGSGDDPILLTLGVSIPLWRDKEDAARREVTARRLAVAYERAATADQLAAAVHRAWYEHTDADRRARLQQRTLVPKARESLRASLAAFRGGETGLLELLDAQRTLLEFSLAAERARADRGRALARLEALVGGPVSTRPAVDEPAAAPLPPETSP